MSVIKQRRLEMDLSRRQLANKLNVHDQVIVRWESKKQVPSILDLPNIYKVMKITLKDLQEDYKEER